MHVALMNKIVELFGFPVSRKGRFDWQATIDRQWCPYLDRKCLKTRKSRPEVAIGTCSVSYGKSTEPIVICPFRFLQHGQIFTDCLHLLSVHEPGNELHVVPEVSVPGGSIDYFLVSAKDNKVRDFAGIELQALDTTGTVWPERQRRLEEKGVSVDKADVRSRKTFGMNWKMTAKTTLIQLHHKIQTFESTRKHLVLVLQKRLMDYLKREFQFSHLGNARVGDTMHIHSYRMDKGERASWRLGLDVRISTDAAGVAVCLGLQADANVELEDIVRQLEAKICNETLFTLRQE